MTDSHITGNATVEKTIKWYTNASYDEYSVGFVSDVFRYGFANALVFAPSFLLSRALRRPVGVFVRYPQSGRFRLVELGERRERFG